MVKVGGHRSPHGVPVSVGFTRYSPVIINPRCQGFSTRSHEVLLWSVTTELQKQLQDINEDRSEHEGDFAQTHPTARKSLKVVV